MQSPRRSFRTRELATLAEARHEGPDLLIETAGSLNSSEPASIAFVRAGSNYEEAANAAAAALCVPDDFPRGDARCLLVHPNPRWVFALALQLLAADEESPVGVHPTAVVADDVELGDEVSVGPLTVIESGVRIGAGTRIGAQCYLGARVSIGRGARIDPRAVIYRDSVLGDGVRLLSGAVVGADGFGFEAHEGRLLRLEHIGHTEIGDGAEIGANACIDRGTTGTTRIGPQVKIDNLVQIGHNCEIGAGSLIAGQSGIAGSTRLGRGVILGGDCAVRDHVTVGDGAVVGGRSAIAQDVPAGARVSGTPARAHQETLREMLALGRLPDLLREFQQLKNRVAELEERDHRPS